MGQNKLARIYSIQVTGRNRLDNPNEIEGWVDYLPPLKFSQKFQESPFWARNLYIQEKELKINLIST
jgi:hypothetical protein